MTSSPTSATIPTPDCIQISTRLIWPAIATLATAFVATATVSYNVGAKIEKAEASVKLIQVQGALQKTETKLAALQEKNAALADANLKLNQANGQLNQTLSSKVGEVSLLASRVNAVSNCAFIHEQIQKLEAELHAGVIHLSMWSNSSQQDLRDRDARDDAKRLALEQKIARYQEQLGPGACK